MKAPLLLLVVGLAAVIAEETSWLYSVYNGEDAMLCCNDTELTYMTEQGNKLKWIRNEVEIQADPMKYEFKEEDGIENIYLIVKNVQAEDYGLYLCDVYDHEMDYKFVMRKAINLSGPLYKDLIDKYRQNIIVGIIAGAVLLGLLLIFCFVYHFRYRVSGDENTYNVQTNHYFDTDLSKAENAFDNPVIFADDDNDLTKADIEMVEQSGANGYDGTTKM